ncbi:uncharacterized protein LY89DRAFT_374393 [Mollisia scopiformis]|uniref:DUF4385 domain containing protein n=1 Tax=Mollisia scopiformis TaxID=149040 RepID=A0A132B3L4_MOLSC|nr:uncharacterized protein LY89DRAFT_374393 [Mollisia scopiformis]KUJ06972.1 hypothetical protein LY89DRAFT_374393 [Mollisia scopiformis]
MSDFVKPSKSHLMTYRIARGEQGVLTYEPYKSYLLPHWRFRTVSIARASSQTLWQKFLEFYEQNDFVGMDMSRKFIQMGMTRSKRYANYKGGRKYVDGKEKGEVIEKSKGHEGKEEKEEASRIFREVWERCKEHEGYQEMKKTFLKEQKEWLEMEPGRVKEEDDETRSSARPTSRQSSRRKCQAEEESIKQELSPRLKSEND